MISVKDMPLGVANKVETSKNIDINKIPGATCLYWTSVVAGQFDFAIGSGFVCDSLGWRD
jgi:hypothetical protein